MRKVNFTAKVKIAEDLIHNLRINYTNNLKENLKASELVKVDENEQAITGEGSISGARYTWTEKGRSNPTITNKLVNALKPRQKAAAAPDDFEDEDDEDMEYEDEADYPDYPDYPDTEAYPEDSGEPETDEE